MPARTFRYQHQTDGVPMKSASNLSDTVLDRLLNLREVKILTSLSKTSIYRAMRAQEFPQAIPIMSNRVAWSSREIAEWRRQRTKKRRETERHAEVAA